MDRSEAIYEQVLVVRCLAGDERAFGELVDRYSDRLRYFLRKMLLREDRAEDALQDVWLEVHRKLSRLKETRAFRAWLYRIARDRAFRELRKRHLIVEPITQQVEDFPQEEEFTHEDAREIHRALDELSADHREILLLRYVEELSYEQLAEVVGCSVGTVRSRLHYAKLALRKNLT